MNQGGTASFQPVLEMAHLPNQGRAFLMLLFFGDGVAPSTTTNRSIRKASRKEKTARYEYTIDIRHARG